MMTVEVLVSMVRQMGVINPILRAEITEFQENKLRMELQLD